MESYLNDKIEQLAIGNPRLADTCSGKIRSEAAYECNGSQPVVITKSSIDSGITRYLNLFQTLPLGRVSESPEERRFRIQREDQWMQFKISTSLTALGTLTQTGIALYQLYMNQSQFAESSKMHLAGLGVNCLGLLNSIRQYNKSQEIQGKQFRESMDAQQKQFKHNSVLQIASLLKQAGGSIIMPPSNNNLAESNGRLIPSTLITPQEQVQKLIDTASEMKN